MEWIIGIFSGIFSSMFQKKRSDYNEKVEKLRKILDEFEKGTVAIIRVESDDELIQRGKDYINQWKGKNVGFLNHTLLAPMERLVKELELERDHFWYKVLKKTKQI